MSAADLARVARAIPELGSTEVVRAAMDGIRPSLFAALRASQRAKFGKQSGRFARSLAVKDIHRGLSVRAGSRQVYYPRIWEGGRRPFASPVVDAHLRTAERAIVAAIEAVRL